MECQLHTVIFLKSNIWLVKSPKSLSLHSTESLHAILIIIISINDVMWSVRTSHRAHLLLEPSTISVIIPVSSDIVDYSYCWPDEVAAPHRIDGSTAPKHRAVIEDLITSLALKSKPRPPSCSHRPRITVVATVIGFDSTA